MRHGRGREPWLSVLFGVVCLSAFLIVARHFSEEREFVRLARQAEPYWLIAALTLQALTYPAQGEIWRRIGRASGRVLPMGTVCRLAFVKLAADQALPSAGFSGTFVVARALGRHGLRRPAVCAATVVGATSFFFAYIVCLTGALALLSSAGRTPAVMVVPATAFILCSCAVAAAMVALSGRNIAGYMGRFGRLAVVQSVSRAMWDADPALVRNVRIQFEATSLQAATFVLDGITLWMLLASLGVTASPLHAFSSFMIANLVRTIGIVPAGLGAFEATAVLMLRMGDVSVAAALSATVLFRVLTFVLPMIPGLWFLRHSFAATGAKGGEE